MVQPPTFHAAPVDGVIVMFTAPSIDSVVTGATS
jgi:hypothetical protein